MAEAAAYERWRRLDREERVDEAYFVGTQAAARRVREEAAEEARIRAENWEEIERVEDRLQPCSTMPWKKGAVLEHESPSFLGGAAFFQHLSSCSRLPCALVGGRERAHSLCCQAAERARVAAVEEARLYQLQVEAALAVITKHATRWAGRRRLRATALAKRSARIAGQYASVQVRGTPHNTWNSPLTRWP